MRGRIGATVCLAVTALAAGLGPVAVAEAAAAPGLRVLAVVAGHGPAEELAVDPGRHLLYVTEGSRRRLDLIDTRTDRSQDQLRLRGVPVGVAVDVRTHRVYVALRDGRVQVLAGARYRTVALVRVGPAATAVAVDPVGHRAYVTASAASGSRGVLAVLNTRRERLVREITVGAAPAAVALDTGAHTAYVLNRGSNTLSVVDTTRLGVATSLPTGPAPVGLAVDTVDHGAWVTSRTGTVEIVYGSDPTALMLLNLGGTPAGLAIDNVHHLAFIANRDGQIQVQGSGTSTVSRTIELSTSPTAVAVDVAARRVYACDGATGAVTVIRYQR